MKLLWTKLRMLVALMTLTSMTRPRLYQDTWLLGSSLIAARRVISASLGLPNWRWTRPWIDVKIFFTFHLLKYFIGKTYPETGDWADDEDRWRVHFDNMTWRTRIPLWLGELPLSDTVSSRIRETPRERKYNIKSYNH